MRIVIPGLHVAVLAAALAIGGCAPTPSPSPTYPVPADAPIRPADCGWPAGTELAYAAYVDEPGQAGLPDGYGLVTGQRVFVLVTLHKVSQQPTAGQAIDARGGCVRFPNGRTVVSTVPEDWQKPAP